MTSAPRILTPAVSTEMGKDDLLQLPGVSRPLTYKEAQTVWRHGGDEDTCRAMATLMGLTAFEVTDAYHLLDSQVDTVTFL